MENKLGLTDEQLGSIIVAPKSKEKPVEAKKVEVKQVIDTSNKTQEREVEVIKPFNLEDWAEKTKEVLRKGNSDYEVIKKSDLKTIRPKSFIFWKIFSVSLLVILIVLSGLFIYYLQDGKLQSLVNNTMSCPDIVIPTCPIAPTCPTCPTCPSLSCATNQTPQINVNLANLNCTVR